MSDENKLKALFQGLPTFEKKKKGREIHSMKKKRGSRDSMFQKTELGRVNTGRITLDWVTTLIKLNTHCVLLLAIRDDRMPLKAFLGV